MQDINDALVGLRFEVSGGLGRMAGRIVGKAGGLYLVRKDGAAHLELLALDDLRSAKFFEDEPAAKMPTDDPPAPEPAPASRRRLSDQIKKHLGGS